MDLPIINRQWCIGCQRCVEACPEHVLAQIEGKAEMIHPEKCTRCAICEEVCPEFAIEWPIVVRFEPKNLPAPPSAQHQ